VISRSTYEFLNILKSNNNRDWFLANKARYIAAREEFENFISLLIISIAQFDKTIAGVESKECVFRINRDLRFSKDKTPYITYLGAHIVMGGKSNERNYAGYYLRFEPCQNILAGGAYLPNKEWIKTIRYNIDSEPEDFKKIISDEGFKKYFGELTGEKLSRPPLGYPITHPDIEILKMKSYLAVHKLSDKDVLAPGLIIYCTEVFKELHPFISFINRKG
jgi:uncharacterized protein (TIGR02453 family)